MVPPVLGLFETERKRVRKLLYGIVEHFGVSSSKCGSKHDLNRSVRHIDKPVIRIIIVDRLGVVNCVKASPGHLILFHGEIASCARLNCIYNRLIAPLRISHSYHFYAVMVSVSPIDRLILLEVCSTYQIFVLDR